MVDSIMFCRLYRCNVASISRPFYDLSCYEYFSKTPTMALHLGMHLRNIFTTSK